MRTPYLLSITAAVGLLLSSVGATQAAPPANDNIAQAVTVTEPLPFTETLSTIEATTATDDPDCAGNGPTVWFSYTPSASGWVSVDTFNSDYDTTLSVYTGTAGNLTQLDCSDDSGGTLQSRVILQVTAGTQYYFMAGAFGSGPGGSLTFTVNPSAPPVQVTLAVADSAVQPSSGTATVRVRATADAAVRMLFISANLVQRSGRGNIIASGGLPLMNQVTNQVEATMTLKDTISTRDHGAGFVGGPARLQVEVVYVDPVLGLSFQNIDAEVKLKGGRVR